MRRRVVFRARAPLSGLGVADRRGAGAPPPTAGKPAWLDAYREPAARLIGEAVEQHLRLASAGGADRHDRQPPQRLAGARPRDSVGGRRDEDATASRTCTPSAVMVPKWVRGSESAEIVEPARHADGRCSASATASARRPTASRPKCSSSTASRSSTRKAAQARGPHRPLQRAVHRTTARRCASAPAGRRARRATAPSRCWSARSARPACARRTPARCSTRATRRRFPAAAIATEDADRLQRMADRGEHDRRPAEDGGALRRRRRVGQRRRRDPRPRAARRSRRRQRPPRLVGRRRRRDRRWRRVRGDVGSAADHEEAEPAAAADRARRAVDQRGERRARRPGLPRSAPRRARQARDDARVRRRRVPAARLRLHRQRRARARR